MGNMKAIFWLGIMVLTQIPSLRFKQSKQKINSFSQRISKINGNRKFGRFDVALKLEFEVKNWYTHTKQLSTNLGCPFGGNQLSDGVPKHFLLLLIPQLNFLKFHLNSGRHPP